MRGICGIVDFFGAADRDAVEQMSGLLRLRGPDDAGLEARGPAALGMRRLSIIDLSGGHQPMINEDGTLWMVFNGEIYNYRTLRDAVRLRSISDVPIGVFRVEAIEWLKREFYERG
jgi:asparagine synthase (glutamine-hydrolysing)